MINNEEIERILFRYTALSVEILPNDKLRLKGHVRLNNTRYRITLDYHKFPDLSGMQLHVQNGLQIVHFNQKSAGLEDNETLDDLVLKLPKLLTASEPVPAKDQTSLLMAPNTYAEIANLKSNSYTIYINDACTRIRFCKFQDFESHHLEVELPSLRILDHSLPDCVQLAELLSKCPTITLVLQQFQKYLIDLSNFYENLGNIDEMCYVLQPLHPSTKDNYRLFSLRERVFIKVTLVDPFSPVTSLMLSIIGPTYEVSALRRRYSEGLKDWDSELNIHNNLLRIFDLCFFPMPTGNSNALEHEKEICNICYSYELDNQVPLISCDNRNCTVIFHAACLREWFNTLSDGKIFLDVSFGSCPFCKAKLSTSFVELLEGII